MSNYPMLNNFISPLDQFLQDYDNTHPKKTLSQEKEIVKYLRIHALRDLPQNTTSHTILPQWDKF